MSRVPDWSEKTDPVKLRAREVMIGPESKVPLARRGTVV
jgi:hypothetical protein